MAGPWEQAQLQGPLPGRGAILRAPWGTPSEVLPVLLPSSGTDEAGIGVLPPPTTTRLSSLLPAQN